MGSLYHRYMCILLYVKLMQCSGVAWIYGRLTGGASIWFGYMCILLYVKLILCSGVAWIYGQLRGVGPSGLGVCAFCYM